MSKSTTHPPSTPRSPVSALQYEQLALAAVHSCETQRRQLEKIVTLSASICRTPALTSDERHRQRALLELLIDTGEDYRRTNECVLELFQVLALDAKNAYQGRMTSDQAIELLTEARTRPVSISH
jgi:hypothetical protein